jgi:hypothetical protein
MKKVLVRLIFTNQHRVAALFRDPLIPSPVKEACRMLFAMVTVTLCVSPALRKPFRNLFSSFCGRLINGESWLMETWTTCAPFTGPVCL